MYQLVKQQFVVALVGDIDALSLLLQDCGCMCFLERHMALPDGVNCDVWSVYISFMDAHRKQVHVPYKPTVPHVKNICTGDTGSTGAMKMRLSFEEQQQQHLLSMSIKAYLMETVIHCSIRSRHAQLAKLLQSP